MLARDPRRFPGRHEVAHGDARQLGEAKNPSRTCASHAHLRRWDRCQLPARRRCRCCCRQCGRPGCVGCGRCPSLCSDQWCPALQRVWTTACGRRCELLQSSGLARKQGTPACAAWQPSPPSGAAPTDFVQCGLAHQERPRIQQRLHARQAPSGSAPAGRRGRRSPHALCAVQSGCRGVAQRCPPPARRLPQSARPSTRTARRQAGGNQARAARSPERCHAAGLTSLP